MKKKTVALLLALVLVFGVAVGGTVAWLTAESNTVNNTFSVGRVDITLDEADTDDSTPNEARDTSNHYTIVPGGTYDKDPTVHVLEGSEDCYVYVVVHDYGFVESQEAPVEDLGTIFDQMEANGWVRLEGATVDGDQVWYYQNVVSAKDGQKDLVVFKKIKFDGDKVGIDTYFAGIDCQAFAIQAEHIGTAAEAWNSGRSTEWAGGRTTNAVIP